METLINNITLNPVAPNAYLNVLVEAVYNRLIKILQEAQAGQCLRISNLPAEVVYQLCPRLRAANTNADILVMLGEEEKSQYEWQAKSTKLIELRNAEERPLLIFMPPNVPSSTNDSIDVSTFREVSLEGIHGDIKKLITQQLPDALVKQAQQLLQPVRNFTSRYLTPETEVRYYLSLLANKDNPAVLGGALCQLGLLPDFAVTQNAGQIAARLDLNIRTIDTITDSRESLLVRLHNLQLRPDTVQKDLYELLRASTAVMDTVTWTTQIATDPAWSKLSFDKLPWRESGDKSTIEIYLNDLNLPAEEGQALLDLKKTNDLTIYWQCNPPQVQCENLEYFRVEFVSTSGAVVEYPGVIKKTRGRSKTTSKKLAKLDKLNLDEGLYFIRVRAYDDANKIISVDTPRDEFEPEGRKINESHEFLVVISGESVVEESTVPRNQLMPSFTFAKFQTLFNQLKNDANLEEGLEIKKFQWETASKTVGKEQQALFTIQYNERNSYSVAVSQTLKALEENILRYPDELGLWQVNFNLGKNGHETEISRRAVAERNQLPISARFLTARRNLFGQILAAAKMSVPNQSSGNLISTVDVALYRAEICEYAAAYQEWLTQFQTAIAAEQSEVSELLKKFPYFLELDMVEVQFSLGTAEKRKALLLAPTHPLRLLWHLQYALLLENWYNQMRSFTKQAVRQTLPNGGVQQVIQGSLQPANLPPMLPLYQQNGLPRLFTDSGAMGHFWQLYLDPETKDSRSVRNRLEQLLGLARSSTTSPATTTGSVSKEELTRKMQRYLYQHPYVDTLKLNVFNPGDARLLVDCLLELQKSYPDLKYQIHLFADQLETVGIGQAIEELINPQRQVSAEQDDFVVTSRNHLFPKLKFSRNSITHYLKGAADFEAHISLLLNYFPVEVNLSENQATKRSSFAYGLIQEPKQTFVIDQDDYKWQYRLAPVAGAELDASNQADLLAQILSKLQTLQAVFTEGRFRSDATAPVLELNLAITDRNLIYLVHQHSDWVLTVDRNLGLDYFDDPLPAADPNQTVYLLDYTPEYVQAGGERLLLTTRSNQEVIKLLRPALVEFGIGAGNEDLAIRTLRSLSGRLVLKLLSSFNKREEVVSLIMAQLFLKQYGLLRNCFIIPLDAHTDLFSPSIHTALEDEISLKRTDLLLIEVDSQKRLLRLRLVEVKARQNLGGLGATLDLVNRMNEQLVNTREMLRRSFDLEFLEPDRLDRAFKIKEFSDLLNFYLERGFRYSLISKEIYEQSRAFINDLDGKGGYKLDFELTGLVFDFSAAGVTPFTEANLTVQIVGHDYVQRLIANEKNTSENHAETDIALMQTDPTFEEITTYFAPQGSNRKAQLAELHRQRLEKQTGATLSDAKKDEVDPLTNFVVAAPETIAIPVEPEIANKQAEPAASDGLATADAQVAQPMVISTPAKNENKPAYDILLGDIYPTPQYGLLGKMGSKTVALDLNGCNTISVFGVQGGGKSYTVGLVTEMALQTEPAINQLPSPLASVIFHYNESQDYAPEFVSMVEPNQKKPEIERLAEEYGAKPKALQDVLLLTTPDKLSERKREFPSVQVEPIYFHSSELGIKDWKFLMSAVSNQSMYLTQMTMIMRKYRSELTLENLQRGIEDSSLSQSQKDLALMRLSFASQFINDNHRLSTKLKPGRLIIVDVRDELIEQDEALGLFVVMLNIFANANGTDGANFNKLIVFDEAHKYMSNPELTGNIVEVIRQMRHQGVSILIASQDPMSLPNAIIELSSLMVLHRFNAPNWIKHIQKSQTALTELSPTQLSALGTGEAYVWANKATDSVFTSRAVKIRCRPRFTQHGGSTKTAVQ